MHHFVSKNQSVLVMVEVQPYRVAFVVHSAFDCHYQIEMDIPDLAQVGLDILVDFENPAELESLVDSESLVAFVAQVVALDILD